MTDILLSTSYFPPISYLKAILNSENVTIEQHENFVKKTYRNRCRIYSANGIINLTVPVVEATRKKVLIRDVKIDYSTDWQKQHFKSIKSAYNSSPFYEYLIDEFSAFFKKKYEFLFDLNMHIIRKLTELLEINPTIEFTDNYEVTPSDKVDYRSILQQKSEKENPFVTSKAYKQVFSEKYAFQKDLSMLDLLFNLGSEAYSYLLDKYKL
jgi:hypothetical protein